jgi:predicted permease
MRLWHMLRSRLRSLFSRDRRESDLQEELHFHLEREADRLAARGMSRDAARLQARRMFGGVDAIKDECRDARGTAFVDDAIRDIVYALRGFRRAPLVAFMVVSTVALGLGLVAAAFTLLNVFLFRVDRVPNVHEMFAVERARNADGDREHFTRVQFDALRRETSVFTDSFAQVRDIDSNVDGHRVSGAFVTGNAFQVLGVPAAMGRALTPADDGPLAERAVMVLSDRGWDRLFARDPAVLSRSLLINRTAFEIVGVMPGGFRGLTPVTPDDYWAPLSLLGQVSPSADGTESVGLDIIGRLKPGVSPQAALTALAAWDAGQPNVSSPPRAASPITLVPKRGTAEQPLEAVAVTAPLFFAFGLILLIGCANVANLLLARGVARQREIGIRLSLGASRRRVVRQLLTENLLLALAAAAAGFAISRVVLSTIVNGLTTSLPPDIGDIRLLVPDADWRVLLFLVTGAVASTIAFALVPALQATRIEPLRTIRGEVVRDARPGRARNVLIGLQVCASALLLISAAVFLRSALTATEDDPGMRISDTVIVRITSEPARAAIVESLAAESSVAAVAASWPNIAGELRPAVAKSNDRTAAVACRFVSPEYFKVLDIGLVRGRTFAADERSPTLPVAVVSEATAHALWPNGDAVGQVVRFDRDQTPDTTKANGPQLESRTLTVVGVVRDVPGFRLAPFPTAVVYEPTSSQMAGTSLVARVHGDPELARQAISNRLTAIDPNLGEVESLRWVSKMQTYFLQLGFWFTVVLGGLALALTVSGLFGVLSYLVEQRRREIGIRIALGATRPHVMRLVVSQSIGPVSAGLLIGGGSAAGLAAVLLATPGAAPIGEVVHVLDPLAYAMSALVIIAASMAAALIPAARAARLDPTQTLRQD